MMTGLIAVLGTSLLLFIGSLAYAVIQDWVGGRRSLNALINEQMARSGQMPFHRAARRPARVLGSFIL